LQLPLQVDVGILCLAQMTGTESAQSDAFGENKQKVSRKKHKKKPGPVQPAAAKAVSSQRRLPEQAELSSAWLIGAGVLVLASTCWSYWPSLLDTFAAWRKEPDYSHGFLVAPLAAFFLYLRKDELSRADLRPSALGLILLLACFALRYAAGVYFLQPLDRWTIPLWLMGAVWVLLGWHCLRWALPSIVFLWFMFPLPYTAESLLSVPLQSLATKLSSASLLMLGLPVLAEGNTLWIGEEQLFVEDACSGLRIFVGIFALAFAFVLFSRWPWWQKVLTLVAALPIAIAANVLRIVGTGLLYHWVSGEAGRHFSHDISGLVMIPLAAGLFWLFVKYLDRLLPEVEMVSPTMQQAANLQSQP